MLEVNLSIIDSSKQEFIRRRALPLYGVWRGLHRDERLKRIDSYLTAGRFLVRFFI